MAQTEKRKVTLKDVSRAAGTSLITVSRALREPETVSQSTRERIHETIAEIGYVPNLAARSLKSNRSDTIGVVVPIVASSLFSDFAQGVTEALEPSGLRMLLALSNWSKDVEEEAVRTFLARQVDAIILTGFSHSDTTRKLLARFDGPIVEAWNLSQPAIESVVGFDNRAAASEVTQYLIDKGYERIVMVGGRGGNNDQAADRTRGFLETMRAAGRPIDDNSVTEFPHPATLESGAALIQKVLAMTPKPDAALFLAEMPAQGALLWCLSNGVRVPEDIAIAGYGDLNISALLPVPLTTVRIHGYSIGRRAAEIVTARLAGDESGALIEDLGYQLQIRKSA